MPASLRAQARVRSANAISSVLSSEIELRARCVPDGLLIYKYQLKCRDTYSINSVKITLFVDVDVIMRVSVIVYI